MTMAMMKTVRGVSLFPGARVAMEMVVGCEVWSLTARVRWCDVTDAGNLHFGYTPDDPRVAPGVATWNAQPMRYGLVGLRRATDTEPSVVDRRAVATVVVTAAMFVVVV